MYYDFLTIANEQMRREIIGIQREVVKTHFGVGRIPERHVMSISAKHIGILKKEGIFQNIIQNPNMLKRHVYTSFLQMLLPSVSNSEKLQTMNALKITDFGNPGKWYPMARSMERRIIAHVGPTNSGKTFSAIQKLKSASSGSYCAPLRLLAMEMYDTMNLEKKECSLITGEAIENSLNGDLLKDPRDASLISCTVEMFNLKRKYDIVVIDEIQMMADPFRGWAFTEAFLGAIAPEIHVCGEESILNLLKILCIMNNEPLEIIKYDRLSPLYVAKQAVGNKNQMKKGDCFVTFSRDSAYKLKEMIETKTRKKCAIIYGKLPLESRRLQAKLFNSPDSEYDFLVATDAIGMGMNLY